MVLQLFFNEAIGNARGQWNHTPPTRDPPSPPHTHTHKKELGRDLILVNYHSASPQLSTEINTWVYLSVVRIESNPMNFNMVKFQNIIPSYKRCPTLIKITMQDWATFNKYYKEYDKPVQSQRTLQASRLG